MFEQRERLLRLGMLATALAGAGGGVCFGLLAAAGLERVVARWDAAAGRGALEVSGGGEVGPSRAAASVPAWLGPLAHAVGAVLGAGVSLGLLGWVVRAGRQRRAVGAIRGLGGEVVYGEGMLPRRWRGTFGADYFAAVVSVHLEGAEIGDAELECLRGLPRLRRLWLGGAAISDGALVHVGRLRRLESLDLSGTGVTDAGVECLLGLKRLRRLWLVGTEVSEAGLEALKGLRRLDSVEVEAKVAASVAAAE